jgi:hypothetical protein
MRQHRAKVKQFSLSAHRTGGMVEALDQIYRMCVADAELILRGLPPSQAGCAACRRGLH